MDEAYRALGFGSARPAEGWTHVRKRAARRYYDEVMAPYTPLSVFELIGRRMPDVRYEVEELFLRRLTERLCALGHPEMADADQDGEMGKCYICGMRVFRIMRWSAYPIIEEEYGVMNYGAPRRIESDEIFPVKNCGGRCEERLRVKMGRPAGYLYESEYIHDCAKNEWTLDRYCGGYAWTYMPELRLKYVE